MVPKSYKSQIVLGLVGIIVYFLLDYGVSLLHLFNFELNRYEEFTLIEYTALLKGLIAFLMLIAGLILFFKKKATFKYRTLLAVLYGVPTLHFIGILVLIAIDGMFYTGKP